MPTIPRILVAGIGNIFLGDDAFGSEVAQRLLRLQIPSNVRVVDFGIRGLDLTYALVDTCDIAILLDAVPRPDEPPGTLFLLEPSMQADEEAEPQPIDAHSMDPMKVLRTAAAMGAQLKQVLIVGCQPASIPSDDDIDTPTEMSAPVIVAVDEAVRMVQQLIRQFSLVEPGKEFSQKELLPCNP